MADIEFREYLPYYKSAVETEIVVTEDEPTLTQINELVITDNLPAGEYTACVSYSWAMADNNDSAGFLITSPWSEGRIYRTEPNDTADRVHSVTTFPVTWAGGSLTITLDATKTSGAQSLTVDWSAIEFERKS